MFLRAKSNSCLIAAVLATAASRNSSDAAIRLYVREEGRVARYLDGRLTIESSKDGSGQVSMDFTTGGVELPEWAKPGDDLIVTTRDDAFVKPYYTKVPAPVGDPPYCVDVRTAEGNKQAVENRIWFTEKSKSASSGDSVLLVGAYAAWMESNRLKTYPGSPDGQKALEECYRMMGQFLDVKDPYRIKRNGEILGTPAFDAALARFTGGEDRLTTDLFRSITKLKAAAFSEKAAAEGKFNDAVSKLQREKGSDGTSGDWPGYRPPPGRDNVKDEGFAPRIPTEDTRPPGRDNVKDGAIVSPTVKRAVQEGSRTRRMDRE